MPAGCRCLLIGNTRWHWADQTPSGWRFEHTPPNPTALASADLTLWAAVGPVPKHPVLGRTRRLTLEDVPLKGMPPWLGVDRALAAWSALKTSPACDHAGLLVADAGTVLSLTRVSADGQFMGGQLAAGFALQLRAMSSGTRNLAMPVDSEPTSVPASQQQFPQATDAAMQRGVLQSLVGLLLEAQRDCAWPLWLCGGDAPRLSSALRRRGCDLVLAPDLVMQGLVSLLS